MGKFHFTSTEGRYFTIHEVNYFTFGNAEYFTKKPQQVADDIHDFGVIGYESVEIFTDLWYNETKIKRSFRRGHGKKRV